MKLQVLVPVTRQPADGFKLEISAGGATGDGAASRAGWIRGCGAAEVEATPVAKPPVAVRVSPEGQ